MKITRRDFMKGMAAAAAIAVLPFKTAASAGRPVPVLLYHDIHDLKEGEYRIIASMFAAQMEWLYSHGYQAISLQDIAAGLIPAKPVVITFDDGHASFLLYAMSLMENYRFKATMNIVGEYVGTYTNSDRISWDEYRYLAATRLISLGCHSSSLHDSGSMTGVSQDVLYRDLMLFQETMARELKAPADIIAWPLGIYNRSSMETAERAGFKYMLTSNPGFYQAGRPLREIPRLNVDGRADLKAFKKLMGAG